MEPQPQPPRRETELLSLEDAERIVRRVIEASQEGEVSIQNTELKELGDITVYEVTGYVRIAGDPEIIGLFGKVKRQATFYRKPFTVQILPDTGKVIGRKLG